MGSISSSSEEGYDQQSERYGGSYSLSADVSESESSSSYSCRRYDDGNVPGRGGCGNASAAAASSSLSSSSPLTSSRVMSCLNNSIFPAAAAADSSVMVPVIGKDIVVWEDEKPEKCSAHLSEMEMMKERFAKLLLGEDMSGGGKGVCTALAISNAITNLSASVFGELWRLEPLAPQKKSMWCREMEWLLSVSDSIVELIPSTQDFPGGGTFEVMKARPRSDLYVNLPALKKLDAMLLSMLESFRETEFWYVERGVIVAEGDGGGGGGDAYPLSSSNGRHSIRQEEKWWLPCPKVPHEGLSENARKRLQQCRDCTNQILKAALAINSSVLCEMEIPSVYLETLPKSGKSCLGDIIYRYITAEQFSPECLLNCLNLSSEHQTLEIANSIEAADLVWRQRSGKKHTNRAKSGRSSWGGKVKGLVGDSSRSQLLAHRAETLLQSLRLRYPGLPQTVLDMNKIQYNKDVGQSILESYSRVMESLAFNIMARIDDVLFVDDSVKRCVAAESISLFGRGGLGSFPLQKRISPSPFSVQHSPYASPFATPTFCSSTPVSGSPPKANETLNKNCNLVGQDGKLDKLVSTNIEKRWSCAGNLSAGTETGYAPERN